MDMSFMAKFAVTGSEAGAVLDHLSAGDVDGEPGWITYTQWLNDDGRIEADLTVSKLDRRPVLGGRLRHRPRPRRRALGRAAAGRDVRVARRDRRLRAAQPPGAALARRARRP